jgi:hypothetical protein
VFRDVDKRSFLTLLLNPGSILIDIGFHHRVTQARFPAYWDVEVYKYSTKEIIHTIGTVVLIIAFILVAVAHDRLYCAHPGKESGPDTKPADNQLIIFFKIFLKW